MKQLSEVVVIRESFPHKDYESLLTSLTLNNMFEYHKLNVSEEGKLFGVNRSLGFIHAALYQEIIEKLNDAIRLAYDTVEVNSYREMKEIIKMIEGYRGTIDKLPEK